MTLRMRWGQCSASRGTRYRVASTRKVVAHTEANFQRDVLNHLRAKLGQEVTEGERLGGGVTDVRFRSSTIELKVERVLKDAKAIFRTYTAQPTQYGSAAGGQLGIVCVLDLTEKDEPPGRTRETISRWKHHRCMDTKTSPRPTRAESLW